MSPPLHALGAISGTSMDAIDLAVIRTDGEGLAEPVTGAAFSYPPALKERLIAGLIRPEIAETDPLTDLEIAVTDAFADAIEAFRRERPGLGIDLVGLHGRTVWHRPEKRFTRQLGDGQRLANRLRLPVVNRFRHADVAAGGQGAPLVPLYHAGLASGLAKPLAILNLGGVANITYLDGDTILACDTGPASALIDDRMRQHFGQSFDDNGAVARTGRIDSDILSALLANPFFALPPPKSLDRMDFHARARIVDALEPADQIATLTAFTIAATAAILPHLPQPPSRWLITGGGRHNRALMEGFAHRLGVPVEPVEAVGWNGDLLEAECFGYLAVRSQRGLPLSLPRTTGVPMAMSGGEYWPPDQGR